MKITKVSYRTNVIAKDFHSKHVEAEASVGKDEDPATVLFDLALWVHEQLGIPAKVKPKLRNLGDE